MSETQGFRSGFVSILGRPNAGKSTLLNALVGQKVAIVADKPQTTRAAIQGVAHWPGAQVVFLDTPGIHAPKSSMNRRMMDAVRAALDQRDLLLFVADATLPFTPADEHAIDLLRQASTPTLLLLNKRDLVKDQASLLPLLDRYRQSFEFAEYLPISADRGAGLDEVRAAIVSRMPEGPPYYPPDHVTDQPERFLACELVREKIIRETHEEVPHSVVVLVDHWEEDERLTRITATVYVERDGQKGILIGARGQRLKKIGTQAREEMEAIFGRRVYLNLHIKVRPNWRELPAFLNALDWRSMVGRDE